MRFSRRAVIGCVLCLPILSRVNRASAQAPTWSLLDSGNGPASRWDHVLIGDPHGTALYLFGGRGNDGIALGDGWRYDLIEESWRALESDAPAARFGSAAALSPDGGSFLLFGGQSDAFFNDLWSFDFTSEQWTLLDDGTTVAPSPRYGLAGAFDADRRFIVSHGFTFEGRFDDTWAFHSTTGWLDISPPADQRPLRRCLHELQALDGEHILLYAGCSSGYGPCPQGDIWILAPRDDTWTQLQPESAPAARSNPAMVSTLSGSVLLVSGLTESGPVSDVWRGSYAEGKFAWIRIDADSDIIPARSSHDMTMAGDAVYLFGGLGVDGALADLWRYLPGD